MTVESSTDQVEKPTLIIFAGKMRSGKDTAAGHLRYLVPSFNRMALADTLKEIVAKVYGISVDELEKRKAEFREKLIFAGQVGRALDPDMWINKLSHKTLFHSNTTITDVRFLNEFHYFKSLKRTHNIYTVRVHAIESIRVSRGAQLQFSSDPSEKELDSIPDAEFDFIIENNQNDISNLDRQVREMIDKFALK
jgi:phosphomevalonate kinase